MRTDEPSTRTLSTNAFAVRMKPKGMRKFYMIKKQTINEIYLGNGILIQQYIFYSTVDNTVLGGVLEAIDSQGLTFNVYSTSNVETLVLQLSYFIDDTMRIYYEETQKENDNYTGLSPS